MNRSSPGIQRTRSHRHRAETHRWRASGITMPTPHISDARAAAVPHPSTHKSRTAGPPPPPPPAPPKPACSDGLDNDGDGAIDAADWGCDNSLDNFENLRPGDPLLRVAEAKEYTRQKLRQRFGTNFSRRASCTITCARTLRRQMLCQTKWKVGAQRFGGPMRVTLTAAGERVYVTVVVSRVKRQ